MDETKEDRWEGESERRFRLKVTCVELGVRLRLKVMRKWSEVCSGVTSVLSVEQQRV